MLVYWVECCSIYFVGKYFKYMFNLFINNIIREPIIDESLSYVFYFFIKYCFGGFFVSEGAFTFKFEGIMSNQIYIYIYIYIYVNFFEKHFFIKNFLNFRLK